MKSELLPYPGRTMICNCDDVKLPFKGPKYQYLPAVSDLGSTLVEQSFKNLAQIFNIDHKKY